MTINRIKDILKRERTDLAVIIGNGVNRFPNNPNVLSWDGLLLKLWKKASAHALEVRPQGISITEFYDILEIENIKGINLPKEVAKLMESWQPMPHHHAIVNKIRELDIPLLTTNYEETFARTFKSELLKIEQEGFSDFYPWSNYHGDRALALPTDGFGIWYINGMIHYHRSIRLGLGHYMGSVDKARNMIHKVKGERLYSKSSTDTWNGHKTWLHIIFNKSLLVLGLGLEENETFLRWLLIERTKYYKQFPERRRKAWYLNIQEKGAHVEGKKFFLSKVGFEVIDVNKYEDIYEKIWK